MKCLVTGGSGFLGSYVAEILTKKGHQVIIYDKKKSKWLLPSQKMVLGSLLERKKLEKVVKGNDFVFHFAALSSLSESLHKPIKTVKDNILGTAYVLEFCRKHRIKRFVFASTIYVNSNQGGFYRSSKKAAEDYVQEYQKQYGLEYTILRFGSIYGPRSQKSNGVRKIIEDALKNNQVSYDGTSKSVREYIYVVDCAKITANVLKKKYKNKHIIITGEKKVKLPYLLNMLAKILKNKKRIRFKNKKILGHYTTSPYTYKPIKGKKFKIKSTVSFETGLKKLIKEIKNKKNR